MKIKHFLFVLVALILTNCISLKVERFYLNQKNRYLIPKLEVEPDLDNLMKIEPSYLKWYYRNIYYGGPEENYYSGFKEKRKSLAPYRLFKIINESSTLGKSIIPYSISTQYFNIPIEGTETHVFAKREYLMYDSSRHILNGRMPEPYNRIDPQLTPKYYQFGEISLTKTGEMANKLISQEFRDNICQEDGENMGYAVWHINYISANNSFALLVPSILTICTINLFGFPIGYQKAEIELVLKILNKNREQIAHIKTSGNGIAFAAMYWGYSMYGGGVISPIYKLTRAAHFKALVNALEKIKLKITQHALELRNGLESNY